MNKTIHSGNLVADPTSRTSSAGKAICDFRLAVSGRGDKTLFLDVTCFDKTAENVVKFKKKGEPLLVEGRLEMDEWQDKTTQQKRTKLYVIASDVEFLSNGKGQSEDGPKPSNKKSAPDNDISGDEPPF